MDMPREVVVALISLCGVALSALVSWLISRYQVRLGIQKIRLEMQRIYAERLHEARLVRYEPIYEAIERHVKACQRRSADLSTHRTFYSFVDEWHTKNGFVLSSDTNRRFYTYMRKARRVTERSEEAFKERYADAVKRREMIRDVWELELGLKNDLGVFELEFFDPDRKFKSYREIDEALSEQDEKTTQESG